MGQEILKQALALWIGPELKRRKQLGVLPSGFKLSNCLIRLPQDQPPIIEFNGEIQMTLWIQFAPGTTSIKKGEDIFLHEIKRIAAVDPPKVNGQRVAFVYIRNSGYAFQLIFDFSPNVPTELISEEEKQKDSFNLSLLIGESLQVNLVEKTIRMHDFNQLQLQKIGLWAAPAIMPYPLSKIIKQLGEDDNQCAVNTLLEYCTPQFLERISKKWWTIEQFETRKFLIQDALNAHKEGKYGLSIYALLPQIEGIITDWAYEKLPESEIPWRQESKTKKFCDLILDKPLTTFTYKRIVGSAMDFILSGPVLATFKKWTQQIDEAFPNRNVVGHGRYEESLFSEENSIKLLLLLDTIYHIISAYSDEADELSSYYL
jgi:hypothetical protein